MLESYRGFLIYLCRTYPSISPYLKGIHLSLDSWRPWRKDDGWKMTLVEIRAALSEKSPELADFQNKRDRPPKCVKWVPRLRQDINALTELFQPEIPPRRQVRPTQMAVAIYQFGDASGAGFGSPLVIGNTVFYQHGQWNQDHADESSNYRELANLVYSIENAHNRGY
jgi:hypothetical protein